MALFDEESLGTALATPFRLVVTGTRATAEPTEPPVTVAIRPPVVTVPAIPSVVGATVVTAIPPMFVVTVRGLLFCGAGAGGFEIVNIVTGLELSVAGLMVMTEALVMIDPEAEEVIVKVE